MGGDVGGGESGGGKKKAPAGIGIFIFILVVVSFALLVYVFNKRQRDFYQSGWIVNSETDPTPPRSLGTSTSLYYKMSCCKARQRRGFLLEEQGGRRRAYRVSAQHARRRPRSENKGEGARAVRASWGRTK